MPKKILVIRLSSLGDIILTTPVYRALKAHWPDAKVSVLVKPQFAAVLEGNPHVDEVIPFQGLAATARRLRAEGFSHLLDLHANLRSKILSRLLGIPKVSVYRKHALARRLFVAFGWRSPSLEKHTVERYFAALAPWGIAPASSTVSIDEVGGKASRSFPAAKKVLILQSAFLGDSLLTLPLARDIKGVWPQARLTVLTLEKTADVFRRSPWVDQVLIDDKRGRHGGWGGLKSLARELRAESYDVAVIPHRSLRSALLAWLAGVPRRVGFSTSAGRFLLTDAAPFQWLMHDLERNLALVKVLEPRLRVRPDESLYIAADPQRCSVLGERLAAAGLAEGRPLVGVHPGSAWPTKRWLPERFMELCRRLVADGCSVVLIGGAQDRDLCGRIAAQTGVLDWSGRTDLNELRDLMPRLSLFVTNDSGPMHLAAACGVPTLALFGPTTRELGFFPYGGRHRVLEADLSCRPCGLHGSATCPHGHFLCMGLLTTETVWSAAKEMLAASGVAA